VTYEENLRVLAELAGDSGLEQDPDFLSYMPYCISSAELRICRDLDLLSTYVTDNSGKLTINSKTFQLPTDIGIFIVVSQLRAITPSPSGPGAVGIFGPPLLPVSKDTVDSLWPLETAPSFPSIPTMWAPIDQANVVVAPPPDQDYFVSVFGTQRPVTLGPKTPPPGTFISVQLRDLFVAAEMLEISAQQRNWSAHGDDPQMAIGWRNEYDKLMAPALIEEYRKKLQSTGWHPGFPPRAATPPQT
jgi:hypothetical protein